MMNIETLLSSDNNYNCLVFRSSLQTRRDVARIADTLDNIPGILDWSVDLEDWEKVLRIECKDISTRKITAILCKEEVYVKKLP